MTKHINMKRLSLFEVNAIAHHEKDVQKKSINGVFLMSAATSEVFIMPIYPGNYCYTELTNKAKENIRQAGNNPADFCHLISYNTGIVQLVYMNSPGFYYLGVIDMKQYHVPTNANINPYSMDQAAPTTSKNIQPPKTRISFPNDRVAAGKKLAVYDYATSQVHIFLTVDFTTWLDSTRYVFDFHSGLIFAPTIKKLHVVAVA